MGITDTMSRTAIARDVEAEHGEKLQRLPPDLRKIVLDHIVENRLAATLQNQRAVEHAERLLLAMVAPLDAEENAK